MALLNFKTWWESSAFTRTRKEIALGLRTPVGMGSLHGHSTASPSETTAISKIIKKKKSKKKKLENNGVDNWLGQIEGLKQDVDKLKTTLAKKKAQPEEKSEIKPEKSEKPEVTKVVKPEEEKEEDKKPIKK